MSEIIAYTNFGATSSVSWQEIINSICRRLNQVLHIWYPGWRSSGGAQENLGSTWLHLIRRDAGEDVGAELMLTDFPL